MDTEILSTAVLLRTAEKIDIAFVVEPATGEYVRVKMTSLMLTRDTNPFLSYSAR